MNQQFPAVHSSQRLVIPVSNNDGLKSLVFEKFGHAPFFAVLDIDEEGQLQGRVTENPCGSEHKPGVVPRYVRKLGTNVVLARKIGETAYKALSKGNIDCRQTEATTVLDCAQQWLEGKTVPLAPKAPHDGEHDCHHAGEEEGAPHECQCGGKGEGGCGCDHGPSHKCQGRGGCGKHKH